MHACNLEDNRQNIYFSKLWWSGTLATTTTQQYQWFCRYERDFNPRSVLQIYGRGTLDSNVLRKRRCRRTITYHLE